MEQTLSANELRKDIRKTEKQLRKDRQGKKWKEKIQMKSIVTGVVVWSLGLVAPSFAAGSAKTSVSRDATVAQQSSSRSVSNGTGGILAAAAVRAASRLATPMHRSALLMQAGGSQSKGSSGGHPVLIGTVVGAGAGAALIGAAASCTATGNFTCSVNRGKAAALGAAVGAGVGALIGLAFRH